VATLSIGALAIEIRDIITQLVGVGNAATLATYDVIDPHRAPSLHKPFYIFYTFILFTQHTEMRHVHTT
jgi:hypothetical protein